MQLDAVGTRSPDGAAVDHDAPLDLSSSRHATDERTTGATSRAKVQLKVPLVHSKLGYVEESLILIDWLVRALTAKR